MVREMPVTRDAELPAAGAGDRLGRGVLNTSELVFMVMAAAAPMAVVVALMPMAFAFGNGEGVPGTYVGAMIAMLLFAVGYVQIIPHVRNAGAFYAYISASFGRTCGLAAAYVAAISYFALLHAGSAGLLQRGIVQANQRLQYPLGDLGGAQHCGGFVPRVSANYPRRQGVVDRIGGGDFAAGDIGCGHSPLSRPG
jgi:hypothetical protein